jgi:Cu-processing system ATP-binding protein
MTGVELIGVHKRFAETLALDNVNLSVPEGLVLGLIGHNGAGKSTLFKLVLGLIAPTSGSVKVLGRTREPGRTPYELQVQIGYLPEVVVLYGQLTGREVMDYFGRLKGTSCEQRKKLLEKVGLGSVANQKVKTYSRGMRQRLGLAQALLGNPRLLVMDEPTTGLDPIAAGEFYDIVDTLRSEDVTIIWSSHVLSEIESRVDEVAVLLQGRLIAVGTMEQIRQRIGLPVTIRISGRFENVLEEVKTECTRYGDVDVKDSGHIEVRVADTKKIKAVAALASVPSLADIQVEPPSLEALYDHIVSEHKRSDEGA